MPFTHCSGLAAMMKCIQKFDHRPFFFFSSIVLLLKIKGGIYLLFLSCTSNGGFDKCTPRSFFMDHLVRIWAQPTHDCDAPQTRLEPSVTWGDAKGSENTAGTTHTNTAIFPLRDLRVHLLCALDVLWDIHPGLLQLIIPMTVLKRYVLTDQQSIKQRYSFVLSLQNKVETSLRINKRYKLLKFDHPLMYLLLRAQPRIATHTYI